MKGWETDPVFARESLTIWVSFESQLLLFSQSAATDTWKQCEVLRSGRYLRTVWFSSKLVGQFTHSLRSLNTLVSLYLVPSLALRLVDHEVEASEPVLGWLFSLDPRQKHLLLPDLLIDPWKYSIALKWFGLVWRPHSLMIFVSSDKSSSGSS